MNNPFRRKQDVSAVPAEIQDYYQSERRERTGVAWLLALGTLIVTIGLATLLFFGGRWAYRAIVNNDDTSQDVAQTDQEAEDANAPESTPDENTVPTTAPTTGTSSTSTSTPNAPSTTPNTTATAPTAAGGSVAGSSTNLPNTGAGDIVAIFAVTTAVGTAAHYAVTRRSEV